MLGGRSRALAWLVWPVTLALLAACAPGVVVEYVPDGGSYTAESIDDLLGSVDLGSAIRVSAEDATPARQEALASLRRHGTDASALADTLTRDFPVDVAAVPVLVERGRYEGDPAWIVVEAWGEPGGKLTHRRLWVFDYDTRMVVAARSAP